MADPKFVSQLLLGAQIALAVASLVSGGMLFLKWWQGQELVPCEPRTPVPWSDIDIYLAVLLFFVADLLASEGTKSLLSVPAIRQAWVGGKVSPGKDTESAKEAAAKVLGGTLRNLAIVPLVMFALRKRVHAHGRDLGLCLDHERYDLKVGLAAFLVVALPVLGIQVALTQFIPPAHSIVDWLKHDPQHLPVLLCGLSVVLITPFAEEFLFRVVLQGWLEARLTPQLGNVVDHGVHVAAGGKPIGSTMAAMPVIISSALFALMHIGQGPAPIPLFVFALVLGYLYRQTHRIWPSVLVHACLNAWSMVMVMLELHLESL